MKTHLCITLLLTIAFGAPFSSAQSKIEGARLHFMTIDAGSDTFLYGINNTGIIAGYYGLTTKTSFTLQNGLFSFFSVPGASSTEVAGINDAGQAFGYYSQSGAPSPGFIYDGQTFTTVEYPGVVATIVTAVLNNGLVVGYWNNPPDLEGFTFNGTQYTPFVAPGKGVNGTTTGGANNLGDLVGTATRLNVAGSSGYFFSKGKFTILNLPGALSTEAHAINDNRVIVGNFSDANTLYDCYYWQNGTFVTFGVPHAEETVCTGINNAGVIVGYYRDGNYVFHGFMTSPIGGLESR